MDKAIICKVDGCCNAATNKGMCNRHYLRNRRHGDPNGGGTARTKNRGCAVDGCGGKHASSGYCSTHYARLKKYGNPMTVHIGSRPRENWIELHKDYAGDDCLKWPFSTGEHGRGTVVRHGKTMSAPRFMCFEAHGSPPDHSYEAAHTCGNGHLGCMNPKHLRWATHMENVADRAAHGRDRKGTQINTNKLTEDQVRYVRSQKGLKSGAVLARELSVTTANISNILLGKSWKHLL